MNTMLLQIIAEDNETIPYRPRFTELTDSGLAAILLQQMIFYWKFKQGKPFYKFRDACDHKDYLPGDSWLERLGWNKYEFDKALQVIGTKIKKGIKKNDVLATAYPEREPGEETRDYAKRFSDALKACVLYWTDNSRVTWYMVNEDLLGKFVHGIYLDKSQGLRYLIKSTSGFTYKNPPSNLPSLNTETPESLRETKEKDSFAAAAAPDLSIQEISTPSAFKEAIEELDMPDTPAAPQREWVAVDESDFDPKPQLQECTSKDIAAMLHAYYIWCPSDKLPTKRGKIIEFSKGIVNVAANREYAENQFQRGMVPSDYIEFLSNLRHFLKVESDDRYERMARNLNVDERLAFKWLKNLDQQKELPFCFIAPIVEEWVANGRDWYTDECPRVVHRHPDVTPRIVLGDDERDNPDLVVDVPPRYVSPHAAAGLDDDDDNFDTDTEPDEMDSWTPEDWEKAGMPL